MELEGRAPESSWGNAPAALNQLCVEPEKSLEPESSLSPVSLLPGKSAALGEEGRPGAVLFAGSEDLC